MAWVATPAISVTVEFKDASGSRSSSQFNLPSTTTLADAITAVSGLVTNLLAVSDATIVGYSITHSVINTSPAAPAASSRVENKGVLVYRTVAGKITRVSVPAIAPATVNAAGGIVSTDTNVTALVNELIVGQWCDTNGQSLSSIIEDYQRFSATSKRQRTTDISPTT